MTTTEALSRVRYFAKQFLRVDEFRDEQLYQLTLRRLHNNAQHTWGIVSGLDIVNEDEATVVRPGYAIDGYGRELLLTEKYPLAVENFDALATDRLDVWLVYDRSDDGNAPAGYGECAASGTFSYRAAEEPKVLVERTLSNTVNARRPPGVPREVLDAQIPATSDDPADTWRVYLGRIIRLDNKVVIEPGPRPYAGVVAEAIDHPANATRVEVGGQSGDQRVIDGVTYSYGGDDDNRRFAVFVPEATDSGSTELAPRLEILANDEIHLRGQTIVEGNLRTVGGAVQFGGAASENAANPPAEPSIYRFKEGGTDTLRVDLGSDTNRRFIIGFSSPDGHFTECLRVEMVDASLGAKTPLVTIAGDLKVNGKLVGEHVDPALSAEALAAIFGNFQAGMAAGNSA